MKRLTFFILALSFLLIKDVCSQDTIVFQAGPEGKYANLWTYHPDNNYGHTALFHTMGWTYWGDPGVIRSLIAFDLSAIPPGAFILDAKLSLYYLNTQPDPNIQPGENRSYLQLITSAWDEETVTWNNPPSTTSEDQVYLPQSTEPEQDYPDIDVTVPIRKIHDEPENYFGLMLRLINEDPYACMLFASGDCELTELRPKLEIIYTDCPVPTVDFDYQVTELSVSFSGISPTAISWHWDFGDGDTSNIQNPVHVYQQQGFYQVCLTVEDTCYFAENCEEVEICIAPPLTGFTYTTEGLTVFFQDTSVIADEYFWDFGDSYYSNLASPWHSYTMNGSYFVCLTASNSCGADTACNMIDICAPPQPGFTYTTEDLTVFFEDLSLWVTEYFWDFGDGYFSSLSNPVHTYDYPGDYEVCLYTWNDCGADTICEVIDFNTVSISDPGSFKPEIYPNPARNEVFIKTALTGSINVRLIDLSGKEIILRSFNLSNNEIITLSLNDIESGIYIVRIDSGKDQAYSKLVVVKSY
jgi:PKD repeat protein